MKKILGVILGIYSKELYCKNNLEISIYYNLSLLVCISWSSFRIEKDLHRYNFQIGILGCHLKITKFKKLKNE